MDRPARITFAGLVWIILTTGLLATLLAAVQKGSVRERSYRAECAGNLHHITLALVQYSFDHDGDFPAVPGVRTATKNSPGIAPPTSGAESLGLLASLEGRSPYKYIPELKVFWCPSAAPGDLPSLARPASGGRNPSFRAHAHCSYAYDPRHTADHKPDVALVADRGGGKGVNSPNHQGDGQNILYFDGHVKWMTSTNCGYGNDEIYVRNDGLADPREDSWLTNSKSAAAAEWRARTERARKRRFLALIITTVAVAVLPPVIFLIARGLRRRRNGGNHQGTKSTKG